MRHGSPRHHRAQHRIAFCLLDDRIRFAVAGVQAGVHGAEPWVFDTGVVATTATCGLPCCGLSLHSPSPYLDATVSLTTSFVPATSPLSVNFLSLLKIDPRSS